MKCFYMCLLRSKPCWLLVIIVAIYILLKRDWCFNKKGFLDNKGKNDSNFQDVGLPKTC